jgi:hydrogenase maturation protein HypF
MLHRNYQIEGIVQGVGFRPFIYQIAKKHNLKGFVLNNSAGVEISIEGTKEHIKAFENDLKLKLPPLARIDFLNKKDKALENFQDFKIIKSEHKDTKYSLISPDFAMCPECYKEMFDKNNRRYQYFFTNCTNCGPRYSIVNTVPYDRPNTSMNEFNMCEECLAEYENPDDRRYHAQPISCPKCGPQLFLKKMNGEVLATNNEAIDLLATLIKQGHIVCLKGMGGFHLICDAKNEKTISTLREKKKRPTKPFAVMFKDIQAIEEICQLSVEEREKICSNQRPIVLVKKDNKQFNLSLLIAPNIDRLGVFLAYTPLHVLLLEKLQMPIIATSANHSGEPIITNEKDLKDKLGHIVEFYLDYNRQILNASDDSVMQVLGGKELIMRASRGVTPISYRYETATNQKILAIGAHQKNAIALYINNQIILSPYIGDLDNISTVDFFKKTLENFKRFYDFEPDVIVGDKHPLYETTHWAKKQGKPFFQVQHHFAHIAATMFEHKLDEDVLGIAWDGTGYGDDGSIWGGEFFVANKTTYKRVLSFEPFSLLGGDASIKDIRRIPLSMILDIKEPSNHDFIFSLFTHTELNLLKQIHTKQINSPKCSAVGRLFDAVAVICGICDKVTYDGESGLLLENLYDKNIKETYNFFIKEDLIRYKHTIKDMIEDKEPRVIASKFINTLVKIIEEVSTMYRLKVLVSGGVFQNRTLLEKLILSIPNLYFQNKTPINDGGIALGQLTNYLALNSDKKVFLNNE